MIRLFIFLASVCLFLSLPHSVHATSSAPKEEKFEAVVTEIKEEKVELLITNGSKKGKTISIDTNDGASVNSRRYQVGDRVLVATSKGFQNKEVYSIADFIRRNALIGLFALFVLLTFFVARKKGLLSLAGMAVSFMILFVYLLPEIAAGRDPIFVAIIASMFIIPFTFYLSHGFNYKTTYAIAGTLIALIITGVLATLFVNVARLSGFASEEAMFVEAIHPGLINMQGLLLAGIIIGALGVLDDITISQAAIIQQLKKTAPHLSFSDLYTKGMEIGRDHIASVVNTLILVYTGAALPLLLLFINNPSPFGEVINYEIIATEIVRTLVASIGLILAVPITTFLTAYFLSKESVSEKKRA